MDRSGKQELVSALNSSLKTAGLVVVTRQIGLTVAEVTSLRSKMRGVGAKFKVTKNRLVRLALVGTSYEHLAPMFTGPTAIAYSEDTVTAAKVVVAFAKDNEKLSVVGGALVDQVLDPEDVAALAALPSLDVMRSNLIGLVQAPAVKIAGVLQAPAGQLARVVQAYVDAREEKAA